MNFSRQFKSEVRMRGAAVPSASRCGANSVEPGEDVEAQQVSFVK